MNKNHFNFPILSIKVNNVMVIIALTLTFFVQDSLSDESKTLEETVEINTRTLEQMNDIDSKTFYSELEKVDAFVGIRSLRFYNQCPYIEYLRHMFTG